MNRNGDGRAWSEEEDRSLRKLYPTGGSTAAMTEIKGRSRNAVKQRAMSMGIRLAQPAMDFRSSKTYQARHHMHPLVCSLVERIAELNCNIPNLCAEAGLCSKAVVSLRFNTPSLQNFEALANCVGLTLTLVELKK